MCHLPPTSTTSLLFQGFQVFHFSPWLKAFCIRKVCDTLHLSFIIISAVSPCVCLHLFHSVILNACCCYCSSARSLHQTVRFISFLLAFYPLIGRVLNPSLRQLVSNQVTLLLLGEPDLLSFESRGNTGSLIGKACAPRTAQGLNPTPGPLLHVVLPLLPSFPVISRLSLSSQRPQNKTKKESINKNIVLLCFKLQCLLWHPN